MTEVVKPIVAPEDKEEKEKKEKEERRTKERDAVRKQVDDAATAHSDLGKKFLKEDEEERLKKEEERKNKK